MAKNNDKPKRCSGCEHYKEICFCGYPPYSFCNAMKVSFEGHEPNSWFLDYGCARAALGGADNG